MAREIYAFKIFLFINQFNLTKQEENSLVEHNCFIVKCSASNSGTAPIKLLITIKIFKDNEEDGDEK